MTGRGAQTVVSLIFAAAMSGCSAGYVEVPIETPIQPKLDVRPFSRVYVAGFLAAGTQEVDGNLETVRLLRSQLRNKGALRVIDADALDLADVAGADAGSGVQRRGRRAAAAAAAAAAAGGRRGTHRRDAVRGAGEGLRRPRGTGRRSARSSSSR